MAASGGGGGGPVCMNFPIGDNGPATNATLDGPVSVALTPTGDLLLSDAMDCRVRRVSLPSPNTYTAASLSASPAAVQAGQTLTLTAAISPLSGSGTPSGAVQFVNEPQFLGSTVLGSAPLIGGTATLALNTL